MAACAFPTERVRNVLVLGHTGTGKSTLVEAMLAAAGHARPHGAGCPTVDHEPEERERGQSLSLAAVAFEFEQHKLNVLDAPGAAELLGDVHPALLAADAAVLVLDATVGIQPQDEQLWRACAEQGLPRVVFLNRLDLERADHRACLADLRARYGRSVAAVHLPIVDAQGLTGLVDVLHSCVIDLSGDGECAGPAGELATEAAAEREALIEAVVENDDALLEAYLEGELPAPEVVASVFAHGIAEGGFVPVLCGAAIDGRGVRELLRFLVEECPSPAEAPHPLPHDGPTVACVAKTFSDQYVGRINLLRVLSGELHADDELTVQRTGQRQRLHQLFCLRGREQLPTTGVEAGDLVAVAKLDAVRTGDLLVADGTGVELDVPAAPPGYHRVALRATAAGDDDKLTTALRRALEEDPSITPDPDGDGRVLGFQGPVHVDVTLARLRRWAGIEVEVDDAPVRYLETITAGATAVGKHVKQTGGHGQYGVAHIELTPLPQGEGFRFEDAIVGGAIPSSLIPSVEKGVREAMRTGPLLGAPVVDVAVRLFDGKHHSVDSSDAAFQMAGILAFRAAVADAGPVLLEPFSTLELLVPDEHTGTVMAELAARRGRIVGTDTAGDGRSVVRAAAPTAELQTFAARHRALTGGRGELTMTFSHHEQAPEHVTRELLAARGDAAALGAAR